MEFEWDPVKANANQKQHGVSFLEASTVFGDPLELSISDPDHSNVEYRFLSVGKSTRGRMLVVSYTERGSAIRIISAREATARERRQYETKQS